MEKELNEAAEAGFQFQSVMGGDSAFGGKEVVVVMSRPDQRSAGRFAYKLLATSKTSTMQKEVQEAADAGFNYRGQTVFGATFGATRSSSFWNVTRMRPRESRSTSRNGAFVTPRG